MKKLIPLLLLAFPVFLTAQTLDTAAVAKEVDSLLQVSNKLIGEQKYEEALQIIEQAEKQTLEAFGENHLRYASCLNIHGVVMYYTGHYSEAEPIWLQCKSIREKVLGKEHPAYASSLNILAILYKNMGRYEAAEPLYLEATSIREKVLGKEHPDYASSLNNLANLYKNIGRYEAVEPLYLEATSIREKVLGKEHPDYASSLNNLANLYSDMGRYEAAEPLLLEARSIREKVLGKEHPDYASSLSNLAALYLEMGRYEAAEPLFLEVRSIDEKALGKEHPDYASSLSNLGSLYMNMGRYEAAELLFLEVRSIWEKVLGKEHPDYAISLDNLASLYRNMGRYEAAEPLYLEASSIQEKVLGKEHPDYAGSLNGLANLYSDMGRYEAAEPLYLEASSIQEKVLGKEHRDYAESLNNLAILYKNMKRYEAAESLYLDVSSIWEKVLGKENSNYAGSLINLAALYLEMGRYEAAEPLYLEARSIQEKVLGKDHPESAISLLNLATLYLNMGRYEAAEPLYLEARSIQGKVLGRDHLDYAVSVYSLAIFYSQTYRLDLAQQGFLETGIINRALLLKATRHLSEQELASYTQLFIDNLYHIYSFTSSQAEKDTSLTAACYDQSLFYKGFLLNTSNQIRHLATSDSTAQQQFELLTPYHGRLAKEYTKPIAERKGVQELETKANEIEKELVRTVAGFGEALRQVNWQEVQQQLKPDEAAVEFVQYPFYTPDPTDSVMYAALVLRSGDQHPHFLALFEEKQLEKILYLEQGKQKKELLTQIYSRGIKPVKKGNLKGLYDLLWQPLDSLLADVKTVYFSPAGLLHRINFNAIPVDKKTTLSNRFDLIQLGSTRSLVVPDLNRKTSANDALLFGGIQYQLDTTLIQRDSLSTASVTASRGELSFRYSDRSVPLRGESWRYLPGTEKEVQNIQALLKQAQFSTQVLSGKNATEEAVKSIGKDQASPRILHLATHGFFFPDPKDTSKQKQLAFDQESAFKISDHPMIRSGLILAGGNYAWKTGTPFKLEQEDGILTAYEISQMNLSNTELVVLSACETGLGDIQGNEGVYGLQRAFKIAGAKYLLMSLWQVPDFPTQELMVTFYKNWLEQKMNIPDAFRSAQQEMRRKYQDPYFWAGFVLVE